MDENHFSFVMVAYLDNPFGLVIRVALPHSLGK